jgi:hypothetical protein
LLRPLRKLQLPEVGSGPTCIQLPCCLCMVGSEGCMLCTTHQLGQGGCPAWHACPSALQLMHFVASLGPWTSQGLEESTWKLIYCAPSSPACEAPMCMHARVGQGSARPGPQLLMIRSDALDRFHAWLCSCGTLSSHNKVVPGLSQPIGPLILWFVGICAPRHFEWPR